MTKYLKKQLILFLLLAICSCGSSTTTQNTTTPNTDGYQVGETISIADQNITHTTCYDYENTYNGSLSLADLNGSIIVIDMSASWCGPCVQLASEIDEVEIHFENNPEITFLTALKDIHQPYSCSAWAQFGPLDHSPVMINEDQNSTTNIQTILGLITPNTYPVTMIIDQHMTVQFKEAITNKETLIDTLTTLINKR